MEEDNNGYVAFLNIDPRISWEKGWSLYRGASITIQ